MITGEDPGGLGAAVQRGGDLITRHGGEWPVRSRRQHVIPDPKPSSCGRNSHGIPCAARTRCQIGPCGQPAACVPGDQPVSGPRAAVARSAPITRPARSTVAAVPSSQRGSTSTRIPVFPHVILFGVLKLLGCLRLAWAGPIRGGYGHRCSRSAGLARSRNDSVAFRSV